MRHIRTLYIFLIFILLSSTSIVQAAPEQRTALVIGNSMYESGRLKNPTNDATDIAAALQKAGFTVILKKNASLKEMENAIENFGNRLKRGGVGLFYFAGHGVQVSGVNYLIPIGATVNKESDVKYQSVDVNKILDEMANANNGLNIVMLDACRDNPYARSFRNAARGLAIVSTAPTGTFISYSTGPGQVARDGEGRNSPYTSALIQYMKKPGLTIEDIFKGVRQKLRKETGQVPWELSSLEGKFYFTAPLATARESSEQVISQERETTEVAMAKRPPTPEESSTFISPTIGAKFVLIPAGTFSMGSPYDEPGHSPLETRHQVTLSQPFYMQTTEVTQGQWKKVMGNNPSGFKCGDDCPVEQVSWNDAQEFIRKLNQTEGTDKYRLPTEAEWEYAARAGTTTPFYTGNCLSTDQANYDGRYPLPGCPQGDYSNNIVHVGSFAPNAWGLYDMHGNVWEWVQDWHWHYPSGRVTDPTGPSSGWSKVIRGGRWGIGAARCRAADRGDAVPGGRGSGVGFRLARTP